MRWVSRELKRNGGLRRYRAAAADSRAWDRALRPKPCKLARHDELRQLVAARLSENWSPQQIAGWLKHTYPDDEAHQVSHECPACISQPHIPVKARFSRLGATSSWNRGSPSAL